MGLKATVAPIGAPEADRFTELLKPPFTAVVMDVAARLLCEILREDEAADADGLGPALLFKRRIHAFALIWFTSTKTSSEGK